MRVDNGLFVAHPRLTDDLLGLFGSAATNEADCYRALLRELLHAVADNALWQVEATRSMHGAVDLRAMEESAAIVLALVASLDDEPDARLVRFRREHAPEAARLCRSVGLLDDRHDQARRLRDGLAKRVARGDSVTHLARWTAEAIGRSPLLRADCPVYFREEHWTSDEPEHVEVLAHIREAIAAVVERDRRYEQPTDCAALVRKVLRAIGWTEGAAHKIFAR